MGVNGTQIQTDSGVSTPDKATGLGITVQQN